MNKQEIEATLNASGGHPDVITLRKGIVTAKRSYFYSHGYSEDKMAEAILTVFPTATIVEKGNHWHEFCGGAKAGSAKDSYFWVKFTV